MNVDYDLYEGETASAQRAPHVLPRDARLRPRRDQDRARARPLRPAVARRAAGRRRERRCGSTRRRSSPTSTSSRTRAAGASPGAKRLAWTPQWLEARAWLRSKLDAIGLEPTATRPATCGRAIDGETDAFLIVGSHIDAVPDGGWLDGALGLMTALETVRQLQPHRAAGRRSASGSSTGPTRRARASGAACSAPRRAPGRWSPTTSAGCADADGVTLGDALAACGVDLDGAARRDGRGWRERVAYLELHIEQGPVLLDGGRLACGGQRNVRRRAAPDDVHRPGRARRLDADAAAPGLAGRGGPGGARDPRERDRATAASARSGGWTRPRA